MKWFVPLFVTSLCVPAIAFAQTETRDNAVFYGADDRADVYEADAEWAEIARQSAVTLMSSTSMQISGSNVSFAGPTLGESQNLCSGQRYADQPTAGFCSGTLIAPDLVLTAGHCVRGGQASCASTRLVFDYLYEDNNQLASVTLEDVYSCTRIVVQEEGTVGGLDLDYAILQLDRVATGRTPAIVNTQARSVGEGTELVMIGAPSGIPTKVEDGGRVRDARDGSLDYFVATTDSFAGNSGSGVWDENTGQIVGILVSGETDYVASGSCNIVNQCDESACRGENVTYAFRAVTDFCQSATSGALCDSVAQCGDGFCDAAEDFDSCSSDCQPPVCGDGLCAGDEYTSCPDDCIVVVPGDWDCDPSYYASFDGCDCECGAYDPDCDVDGQEVLGCGFGGACLSNGACDPDAGFGCDVVSPSGARGVTADQAPIRAIGLTGIVGLALIGFRRRRRNADAA